MNAAAATSAGVSSTRSHLYKSEVRFGVVMYGGVSLAIYINGVANEMYEMACATPKVIDNDAASEGTCEVYRKASLLRGDDELCDRYLKYLQDRNDGKTASDPLIDADLLDKQPRTRFVVDVISGTSAGGINGAFLAKALANGQKFSPLKDLWIEEGNIDKLLNDDKSYQGLEYADNDSPTRSLLNSDRMYVKLLGAFQDMQRIMPTIGESESQLADEIDLYMTTTDIRGTVVPLRLFDGVTYEKRFRQVYHFQYAAAAGRESRNDFSDMHSPFLAFAARCTSSFPFAFEPMTVTDAERLYKAKLESVGNHAKSNIKFDEWKPFFAGLSAADMAGEGWRTRAFGDGGYLDNKPFSYVVEALSWRLGDLPTERKLIYVEPAPAHPELERNGHADKPDALENAFKALNTIPQYETIREDLEAVLNRNRRIERVERIVRLVEADLEADTGARESGPFARVKLGPGGEVPDWSSLDLKGMIDYYGVAFLPYRRLRIASVTDDIAERLAIWWGVDRRSDRLYALTAMARVWREARYYENKRENDSRPHSVNKFLYEYDVKYRLRRVGFLLRKVHQLHSLAINWERHKDSDKKWMSDIEQRLWERLAIKKCPLGSMEHDDLIAALNCLARGLGETLQELRAVVWPKSRPLGPEPSEADRATLDRLLRLLLGEQLDPPLTALPSHDGESSVRVAIESLPPRNRLRTLQEDVLARTQALFGLAAEASKKTAIQHMLEENLAELQRSYEPVILSSRSKAPLARDLLGEPTLVAVKDSRGQLNVEVKVNDRVEDKGKVPYCEGKLDSDAGKILRKFLAEYYLRFDEYDQMSFPLYYDTGTGEPATVEVFRVSPEDARGLIDERSGKRKKLAGTVLFNFGAFLEEKWRRNDIMWGRLDGCERLLAAMFPTAEVTDPSSAEPEEKRTKAIREALLQEAQHAILREELQPKEYALLIDRFGEKLAKQEKEQKTQKSEEETRTEQEAADKAKELKQAFEKLSEHLAPADIGQRDSRIARALGVLLDEKSLVEYVRRYYEVDRKPDRAATMKTGARALTITGRILEEAEKRYREAKDRAVWVTRGGRALQVLLTISTPGDIRSVVFRHWLIMLYIFEAFIVAGAFALSAPTVRTFGLTCLIITGALHIASLIAGDLMDGRPSWARRIVILLALILTALVLSLLVLALLGATAWSNGSLCPGKNPGWFLWSVCGLMG